MKNKMKEMTLKISFNAPAFLGNAQQRGQWRTPPFKALIRQWWRVVKAKEVGYDYKRLLQQENELFGQASDKEPTRSRLQLRLNHWGEGSGTQHIKGTNVNHKEVKNPWIDSALYLGYGPVTTRETKKYISPQETPKELSLRFPEEYRDELEKTIKLIATFGTIGSRSRNGWGSIKIEGYEPDINLIKECSQNIADAIKIDWPHCIGKDAKGLLVWHTNEHESFQSLIKELAQIKIDYRTAFEFRSGQPHPKPLKRHILSYPITRHELAGMRNDRNANQLRFKIHKNSQGKHIGLVFHLPCTVSKDFFGRNTSHETEYRRLEQQVWLEVHSKLDKILKRGIAI